jgi:hypothetical protein
MFKFKVDTYIISEAKELIKNYNFGQRSKANGTPAQQLIGVIGEIMIRNLFKAGKIDGSIGFDGGYDLDVNNKLIDVKTMGRTTDPREDYVNNFIDLQLNHKAKYFIFNSLNKKTKELTVCGWISKEDFLKLAKHYPEGSIRKRSNGTEFKTFAGLYEIENRYLNKVESPEELIKQLNYD